jgi:hypothetical protein
MHFGRSQNASLLSRSAELALQQAAPKNGVLRMQELTSRDGKLPSLPDHAKDVLVGDNNIGHQEGARSDIP